MTMIDGLPVREDEHDAEAARQLRLVAELVVRYAPPGFSRDVTDILRRTGLMIAALTEHDVTTSCRRCAAEFTYDSAQFRARHLDPPRHCFDCRQARRRERERAGITANVPPDDGNPGRPNGKP